MRFLVDAQLPRRIAHVLRSQGHDALHTLDLPDANRTTDTTILAVAAHEQRVVITKDADFIHSYLLARQPEKLLLISTGNIRNVDLEAILLTNLPSIVAAFETKNYVQITRTDLIIHS